MRQPEVNDERVLVVDDEPDIVALVAYHLAKAGFRVATATDGAEAIKEARKHHPSLVVLDLMLTARKDEPDRIKGLSLGADDYLTKPFSPAELVLRVKAILRRTGAKAERDEVLRVGDIAINRSAHT